MNKKVAVKTEEKKANPPTRPFALKADEVAAHFGFIPIDSPIPGRQEREYAKELLDNEKEPMLFLDEDIAFVKKYINENWNNFSHPLLLVSHASFEKKKALVSLRLLGIGGSAGEALAIRAALSLLEEAGHKNLAVALGSIGDRESMNDFDRAAATFTRKNTPLMPPELKKEFRENPLMFITDKKYEGSPFADRFPTPIAYLSPNARNLLKEVIEYIETMGIPYVLDTSLLAPRSCAHQIVFEIKDGETGETLARGMRLTPLIRKLGAKRETPFISVMVSCGGAKAARKKLSEPKFHFVQLGYAAKLLSLPLIENLRQVNVSVTFHISRDKLVSQLGPEEKTPFLIIMGYKEALEKTVVVRDNETRAQEAVSIEQAPAFIKKVLKRGKV